ncbi:MAG: hypothetical protein AB7U39_19200, partial [Ilumatobacteraceae bacterium]
MIGRGYAAPPDRFDEAVAPDGSIRPAWSELGAALGDVRPGELAERQRQADRLLVAEGAGHLVHELTFQRSVIVGAAASDEMSASRPWRLDPVPLLL